MMITLPITGLPEFCNALCFYGRTKDLQNVLSEKSTRNEYRQGDEWFHCAGLYYRGMMVSIRIIALTVYSQTEIVIGQKKEEV